MAVQTADKKPVTVAKEDVDKYTILDVVLPLPGWDVKYPDNVCGEWYAKLLEEDDLSNELLRNKVKYAQIKYLNIIFITYGLCLWVEGACIILWAKEIFLVLS